jgi:hypothetical protein
MNTGLRTPGIASPLQKRYLARSNKDSIVFRLRLRSVHDNGDPLIEILRNALTTERVHQRPAQVIRGKPIGRVYYYTLHYSSTTDLYIHNCATVHSTGRRRLFSEISSSAWTKICGTFFCALCLLIAYYHYHQSVDLHTLQQ